jgi:dienelactone hydrolase
MPSLVLAAVLFVTNPQDAGARAREVIALLAAKDFAKVEALYDDRMKAGLPPGRIESVWTTMLTLAGPFKACGAPRTSAAGEVQVATMTCDFELGKIDAQIAFDQAGKLAGLFFRPAAAPAAPYALPPYATPSAYAETDQIVGSGEWALPGTLTMPAGAGPWPAVILVAGSGPNDRDETIGPNKPFRDLAVGLASRGVASLRYDKRTKVYPSKLAAIPDFTVKQEVLDDVLEAAKTLRANPKVDSARVFVLGHSLGGMLIPRIGAADPALAGLIVMAGPARSIDEAILEQTRYLAMADGTISPDEQAGIDEAVKIVATVKALTPEDAKSALVVFHAPASYWLDLRGYDAPSAARALKAPMLVLQGERDYQVTMPEFEKWKAALAGRSNVAFHTYPALNHLFIAGTGKSLPAEYATPAHVAEDVIRGIADWIKR